MIIKTEQGQTPELLADLNAARAEVEKVYEDYDTAYPAYDLVRSDLNIMEEKIKYLADIMRQTMDVTLPDTTDAEEDAVEILMAEGTTFGLIKNIAWLGTAPLAISLVADAAAGTKWAQSGGKWVKSGGKWVKTGKVVRFAKWTKASKAFSFMSKAGKVLGPAALAMEIGLFAWAEGRAKQVNEDLRDSIKKMKEAKHKAEGELAKLRDKTRKATKARDALLAEAGAKDVGEYSYMMQSAFGDAGRMKEAFTIARNMLRKGMDKDFVLSVVAAADADLLDKIETRIAAETRLAANENPDDVAAALGLDDAQIAEIAALVDARDAYLRGVVQTQILDEIGIAPGTYREVETNMDAALANGWADIEGDAPLDDLAHDMLARADALEDLRTELRAKDQIAAGKDLDAIAAALSVPRAQLVLWSSQKVLQLEEARLLKQDPENAPDEVAAETRLSRALVAAA